MYMYKEMTYTVLGTLVAFYLNTHTDWLECYENKHVLWSFEINITVCAHILYIVHVVIFFTIRQSMCPLWAAKCAGVTPDSST